MENSGSELKCPECGNKSLAILIYNSSQNKFDENDNRIPDESKVLSYIYINGCKDETDCCTSSGENCEGIDYVNSFKYNICPKGYECLVHDEVFYCNLGKGCPVGQHRDSKDNCACRVKLRLG